MARPYPREFRDDVVRVARSRDAGVTIEQIAADFGVHPITLSKWMPAPHAFNAAVVTTSSQPGTNWGSRLETARDGYCWSDDFETLCETTKFTLCPTGGQVGCARRPVPK